MFDLSSHTQDIVLIFIALAVIGALFARIIDAKDFIILASMVFAFYFTNSRDNSTPT